MSPIRAENRDRYPANWAEISISIRAERAGWHCECEGECGRGTHEGRCPNRHGEPAYGTGSLVVLTTAHLDHTPENCDPANLRAMCQGCHLHYDRDHHAETRRATREVRLGLVPLFDEFPRLSAELEDLDEESERQLRLANLDVVDDLEEDPACDDPDCTCHDWLTDTFLEPPWITLIPNARYL